MTIPNAIKSSPDTKINADWLKEEFIDCIGILCQSGFSVRAIGCNNRRSNLSNFKNLLQHFNQNPDELFIWYELRKINLFYDDVILVKYIRDNFLNYKRFIFPSLKFHGFKDPINVPGGEIKWKSFHGVHVKDALLETNLRKTSKLTGKVLHPGNCKRSVSTALVMFYKATTAAIQFYFPDESSTVELLKWCVTFFELWLNEFKHGKQKKLPTAKSLR